MKKIFLLAFSTLTLAAFAQEKQKGFDMWLNSGIGIYNSSKHNNLIQLKSGLNMVIHEKHYFGAHANISFYKNFLFDPDKMVLQSMKYVNYGQREKINDFVYFTPSVGIGIANYSLTRFYRENSSFESSFIADLLFDATGKTLYANYREQSICVPVTLQFDFTGRIAGLGLGLNMVIMKYPSFGLSADILLGKIRPRIKK